MTNVGSVVVELLAQGAQRFQAAMKMSGAATQKMQDAADKFSGKFEASLSGMAQKADVFSMAALKMTGVMAGAGGIAVKMASNFEETSNVIQVSFGKNSEAIESWSKDTGQALGRSTQQVRESVGTFKSLFDPMISNEKAATEMSKAFSVLAVDMASFRNKTDEQAFNALQSAIAGQSEPLRAFGITMNEAALSSFALSKGIQTPLDAMSEGEKTILRFNFVMANSSKMQTDATRTAAGFANRFKALQGAASNVATAFGKELLPMVTNVVATMVGVLKHLENLDAGTIRTAASITALGTAGAGATGLMVKGFSMLAPVVSFVGTLTLKTLGSMASAAGSAATSFAGLASSIAKNFIKLAPSLLSMAAPLAAVAGGLAAAVVTVGALKLAFDSLSDETKKTFSDIGTWVSEGITKAIEKALEKFTGFLNDIADAVDKLATVTGVKAFIDTGGLRDVAAGFKLFFKGVKEDAKTVGDGVIDGLTKSAKAGAAATGITSLVDVLNAKLEGIKSIKLNFDTSFADDAIKDIEAMIAELNIGGSVDAIKKKLDELKKFGMPDATKEKPTDFAQQDLASAAGGKTKALVDASRHFDEMISKMRDKLASVNLEGVFQDLKEVVGHTHEEFAKVGEAARKSGSSDTEGLQLARKIAGQEMAARLRSIDNLRDFDRAVVFARGEMAALGGALPEATPFMDLGGVFTKYVGDMVDSLSNLVTMDEQSKGKVIDALSSSLAGLFEGGKMDLTGLGQGLGRMLGASDIGKEAADLFRNVMGGTFEAAKASISAGFSAAGGFITSVASEVFAAAQNIVMSMGKAVAEAVPNALKGIFDKAVELIPGDKAKAFLEASMAPLFAAMTALAPVVGAVLGPVIGSLPAAAGTILALTALLPGFGIALTVATVGALAFAAALAVPALLTAGVLGLVGGFLKLATETESFAKLQRAFQGSMSRVVTALEPFFNNFMAMAGLFDGLVSVLLPLATAFANNRNASRLLFDGFKMLALVVANSIYAVALFADLLLDITSSLARTLVSVIDGLAQIQNIINDVKNAMLSGAIGIIDGITGTFGPLLGEAIRGVIGNVRSGLEGGISEGPGVQDMTGGLRNIAAAADSLSPDLNAIASAITDLSGLTYDEAEALAELRAATDDQAKAATEASESLSNVPSGYKVALARFDSIDAIGTEATGTAPSQMPFMGNGLAASPITIQNMTVVSNDPATFSEQLNQQAKRETFIRTGTTNNKTVRPFIGG